MAAIPGNDEPTGAKVNQVKSKGNQMSNKYDGMSDREIIKRIRDIRQKAVRQGFALNQYDGLPIERESLPTKTITKEILSAQAELYRRNMPEA